MDKILLDCLKKCVAACQAAVDAADKISDELKSSLKVCIVACQEAVLNPTAGTCAVAWEEAQEVIQLAKWSDSQACKDAAITCAAVAEAGSQKEYGIRSLRCDNKYRFIICDNTQINREAKTIPLSFSSEQPAIQRADDSLSYEMKRSAGLNDNELYIEILDHSPGNVDTSILKNKGAFLDEHRRDQQIGVVEDVEIGADKIGRAVIRCGTDALSVTRFSQMDEGIRTHISAGYKYTRFVGNDTLPDGRIAKRFAFQPFEISSVAIPADGTIGVARSYSELKSVDSPRTTETKITMPDIDIVKQREEERNSERTRSAEISKIADALIADFGNMNGGQIGERIRAITTEAITTGLSIGDYQVRAMKDVIGAKPAKPVLIEDCTEDPTKYSLIRGIQTAFKNRDKGGSNLPDGLELEVHNEVIRRSKDIPGGLGYNSSGFQVPANAQMRVTRSGGYMRRDMTAGVFGQGGAFVPNVLTLPIIELLRNREVLSRLGIRNMAGLQGNILIPRQEAAGTAYSVSEIAQVTASNQILGQIAMSPHRVGTTGIYSRQLVMQSSPDVENFIRDDYLKDIALKWDYLGLNGQGAGDEPLGVFNTPGINTVLFGTTPTYAKIIDMETAIRTANVIGTLAYITTPTVKGSLKKIAEALTGATTIGGSQNAVWKSRGEGEGELNGYLAIDSNQVPNNQIALGEWDNLIKALWGGLEVVVDIYTQADKGEVKLTMNTWGDYAVRHPQAFNVSADAGNQ